MSWLLYHSKSEDLASQAELSLKQGDPAQACTLYRSAAAEETKAVFAVDSKDKARTFGISAVSAVSLWYKAQELDEAQRLALIWLNTPGLPDFAFDQLRTILQKVWNDISYSKMGIEFVKEEVLVSIDGGQVVSGGAPLDLINRKVTEISSIFYRTIEWELKQPFRKRGLPSSDIQDQFRPYLFQAPPGSYQFAVRVQKPKQLSIFSDRLPKVEQITERFFEVMRATTSDSSQQLKSIVPDEQYRDSFLKLARNLAPSGKSFGKVEIKMPFGKVMPVVLLPESRSAMNNVLKKERKRKDKSELKTEIITGVLRGLHLDEDWLEISVPGTSDTLKVRQTGDVIDDVVGPMVNHTVSLEVSARGDGILIFRDIQPVE